MVEGWSWVPPGLAAARVPDYMAGLPGEKVPRPGTAGQQYRERQLELQLPKQVGNIRTTNLS